MIKKFNLIVLIILFCFALAGYADSDKKAIKIIKLSPETTKKLSEIAKLKGEIAKKTEERRKLKRKIRPTKRDVKRHPCGSVCDKIAKRCSRISQKGELCYAIYKSPCYKKLGPEATTVNNCWRVRREKRLSMLQKEIISLSNKLFILKNKKVSPSKAKKESEDSLKDVDEVDASNAGDGQKSSTPETKK